MCIRDRFKTPSGQPLYFNFHYSKGDEDAYDKKLLGNTRMIGQSGAGKTVMLNALLVQAQKFKTNAPMGFTTVFFDKDEGAKLCIKAIGGKYLSVENGKPTGFQPMQIEPTESNILFLEKLIKVLVSGEHNRVTTTDEHRISHAVRTVMRMPLNLRRLSTVLQNMTEGTDKEDRENSVAKRLSRWCYDDGRGKQGPLAWVFGAEGQGVRADLVAAARLRIRIPMPGAIESLNVAAAAAVCLFECLRRREAAGGDRQATSAK